MLTARDVRMLNGLLAELKAGKKVVYRPIDICRRLDKLAGATDEQLRVWDKMQPKFKRAYPLEAGPLKLALNRVRQRTKGK